MASSKIFLRFVNMVWSGFLFGYYDMSNKIAQVWKTVEKRIFCSGSPL